jgi:hypothetical protein
LFGNCDDPHAPRIDKHPSGLTRPMSGLGQSEKCGEFCAMSA